MCNNGLFGFYSELHVTLPVATYDDCTHYRSKEVDNIEKRFSGVYIFNIININVETRVVIN